MLQRGRKKTSFLTLIAVLCLLAASPHPARAERPPASKLLPKNTLAVVHVADCRQLAEDFQKTSLGRIGRDPQIKPLVTQLYGEAVDAFKPVEDRLGLSLGELLSLPQGELCMAFVAPEEGGPEFVAMVEVGSQLNSAQLLVQRVQDELIAQGAEKSQESDGETQITVLDRPGQGRRKLVFFERDGAIFISTNLQLSKEVIGLLRDSSGNLETLADNEQYRAIMKRCQGAGQETPHLSWYIDPIELYSRAGRGDARARTVVAALPILGLDGLKGIGGNLVFATEEFDAIARTHVLVDGPRTGVVEMLALESGDTTPEKWVPQDVASYTTLHWDFAQSLRIVEELFDGFNGEGAFATEIDRRISDRLEIDFRKDVIDQLDGRLTYITWMERPARLNSQATLVAVQLAEPDKAARVLDRVMRKYEANFKKQTFGGVSYYQAGPLGPPAEEGPGDAIVRRAQPCLAVVGEYLMTTGSPLLLQEAISTKSRSGSSLADHLEFKLIASKITRQRSGERPGMLSFNRPEEGMRLMYELATGDAVRSRLAGRADDNRLLGALNTALDDHPLPPFSVIAQYLAPGGSIVTNESDGFHYVGFTLRRK